MEWGQPGKKSGQLCQWWCSLERSRRRRGGGLVGGFGWLWCGVEQTWVQRSRESAHREGDSRIAWCFCRLRRLLRRRVPRRRCCRQRCSHRSCRRRSSICSCCSGRPRVNHAMAEDFIIIVIVIAFVVIVVVAVVVAVVPRREPGRLVERPLRRPAH